MSGQASNDTDSGGIAEFFKDSADIDLQLLRPELALRGPREEHHLMVLQQLIPTQADSFPKPALNTVAQDG